MQLKNAVATQEIGAKLAVHSKPPLVIYLTGELGSGKTTLARGFIQALGYEGNVKSPTFSLVENYHFDTCRLFHFDLYRLNDPQELEFVGIRDMSAEEDVISLIEWPERGGEGVPPADLSICLEHSGEERSVKFIAHTAQGQSIIDKM